MVGSKAGIVENDTARTYALIATDEGEEEGDMKVIIYKV
jgi:hypothetical protein